MVTIINFKLRDIKLESSEAYLYSGYQRFFSCAAGIFRARKVSGTQGSLFAGVRENLSWNFEVICIFFCKNSVLNMCRYLIHFYTYKIINNIFLKVDHSLLRMLKVIEIG